MYAWSKRVIRTRVGVHCATLAVSTFLAGLYFGQAIPAGVNLLMLQAGTVGVIAFLGLTHLSAVRHLRRVEDSEAGQVEDRLTRHTQGTPRLIVHTDRMSPPTCHFSVKSADQATVRTQADRR